MARAIEREQIDQVNKPLIERHRRDFEHVSAQLEERGVDVEGVLGRLLELNVTAPSWAFGTGGTRFGRFPGPGEPHNLDDKLQDCSALAALTGSVGDISLHIPWDRPEDPAALAARGAELELAFGPVNSNTFQDQPGQQHSYKFGALSNTEAAAREQAVEHMLEVIEIGRGIGSKALSVWLSDGSSHPGAQHIRRAFDRVADCLKKVYGALPGDWRMFTEHKPFEPAFYNTVVSDWGASLEMAREVGERVFCLVDLGHHLHGTNIEQVVAYLLRVGRLGGFHFNDSKYADDDLTTGSLKPFQLFLIFYELLDAGDDPALANPPWDYMIDQSHNMKDPIEDLIQSVDAIQRAFTQAAVVEKAALEDAQQRNDNAAAQEVLQRAFRTDVGPLAAEARLRKGAAIEPLAACRQLDYRGRTVKARGAEPAPVLGL